MPETITAAMTTALDSGVQEWRFLFELNFLSESLRVWSGEFDIDWDGKTWIGKGQVMSLGAWEETADNAVLQVELEMQATDPARITQLISENEVEGRPMTMWAGLLDRTTNPPTMVADPILVWTRLMNSGPYHMDRRTWSIYGESKLVQRSRGGHRTRSHADQKRFAEALGEPNDEGMINVTSIFRKSITWPSPRFRAY